MNEIDLFLNVVDSLSKYRRAELKDDLANNLIEKLYVDPLENDLVLKSMMKNNSILLIGRKGTGKSTIINRFQHEIRKTDDRLSLYIDVKALFEQSKKTSFEKSIREYGLSQKNLERLNLYLSFIERVIDEIKNEIKKNLFTNSLLTIFKKNGITKRYFDDELERIFKEAKTPTFQNITSAQVIDSKTSKNIKENTEVNIGGKLSIKDAEVLAGVKLAESNEVLNSEEFSSILTRYFNIISIMNDLKILLKKVPINDVSICLDDVSEIDKDSMEVFINFIVAPLNNLSEEYFKFKISLYPGRDFLPGIDRQKVKTFNLDYYDLYSVNNSEKVEEQAISYTQKLLEKRFEHYFGNKASIFNFFNIDNDNTIDEYYKLLFQISSNVPRLIGKVLDISLQKTNSLTTKINKKILQESARQHYKNDIEYILKKNEYIEYKSYDETFEQYHLSQLLSLIIKKAIENKKHIGQSTAKIFSEYNANNAPSNYLYIPKSLEDILKTLEFNFFITKFSEQKHRDGDDISVFVLNYGLCIENNIIFDTKSNRKFRVERIFDYEKLLRNWMNNSKKLVCDDCSNEFSIEQREMIIKFGCPLCKSKSISIKSVLSDTEIKRITSTFKLPQKEFEILNALNIKNHQTASELGSELDRSYQSINQSISRNSKIAINELIIRLEDNGKAIFEITNKGMNFLNNGIL